jgi:hypothetical protein
VQDASKDRKEGRSWKSLRRVPKATIKDTSIEATAVRADGTHHTTNQVKLATPASEPEPVHMPHVI